MPRLYDANRFCRGRACLPASGPPANDSPCCLRAHTVATPRDPPPVPNPCEATPGSPFAPRGSSIRESSGQSESAHIWIPPSRLIKTVISWQLSPRSSAARAASIRLWACSANPCTHFISQRRARISRQLTSTFHTTRFPLGCYPETSGSLQCFPAGYFCKAGRVCSARPSSIVGASLYLPGR